MQKMIVTMMTFALTVSAQMQAQNDGLDDIMAEMIAAKVHQVCIDTANLMVAYDYECRTQDADGKPVTDRMKLCLLVGQHCTRSFPYRKFLKEREWASGNNADMRSREGAGGRLEFYEGYDFCSDEDLPLLRSESYCHVPEVWMNHPDGQVSVRDAIPPTIYETREERKPIKWELGERTATCELHGVKWTVRYDEDIPTTAGPWKLCGLPGLITEAVSDGGIHRFTLIDLQRTAAPIYYETSAITVRTSEEKLIKNRIKTFGNRLYLKNPWGFISDHSNADKVHDTEGSLINGVYMHNRPHVFQPLDCK